MTAVIVRRKKADQRGEDEVTSSAHALILKNPKAWIMIQVKNQNDSEWNKSSSDMI